MSDVAQEEHDNDNSISSLDNPISSLSVYDRDYQIFPGLDVDKHSIAVTFCNQEGLLRIVNDQITRGSERTNLSFHTPCRCTGARLSQLVLTSRAFVASRRASVNP